MKVVFFGIYKIGVDCLTALRTRGIDVRMVVTKPSTAEDRQPVSELARNWGLPLLEPATPGNPTFLTALRGVSPDIILVGGYHKIFPKALLEIPPRGAVNLHLSLLPRYRGPAPWKWTIANGETTTGITVIQLEEMIDTGPILGQWTERVRDDDTGASLFERLCVLGAERLADVAVSLRDGGLTPRPQDENDATYQRAPTEEDARIDWRRSAHEIRNLVRGFFPRPGAWTTYQGIPLTVRKASVHEGTACAKPGTILDLADRLLITTGKGLLAIDEIADRCQRAGEPFRLQPGTSFDHDGTE